MEWDKILRKLPLLDKTLLANHNRHQALEQIPKVEQACLDRTKASRISKNLKEVEGFSIRLLNQLLVVYLEASHRTQHLEDHLYLQLLLKLASKIQEEDFLVQHLVLLQIQHLRILAGCLEHNHRLANRPVFLVNLRV